MKEKAILFLIAGAIFISACAALPGAAGPSYSGVAGVQINLFQFDIDEVWEREEIGLNIEIENVGSKPTTGATKYWVYDPAIDVCTKAAADMGDTEPTKWCLDKDSSQADKDAVNASKGATLTPSGFLPPVMTGERGDINGTTLMLVAPNQRAYAKPWDYTFYMRVCYPYTTTSTFAVTRYSTNEYRSSGVQKQTETQKRQSSGPIQIDMPTGQALPIRGNEITLFFTVEDKGGGFAMTDVSCAKADPDFQDRNEVNVTVYVDGESKCTRKLSLRDGTSSFRCRATGLTDIGPTRTFQVVAEATYAYYIDASTQITVKDIEVI